MNKKGNVNETILKAIGTVVLLFVFGAIATTLLDSPAIDDDTKEIIEDVKEDTYNSVRLALIGGTIAGITILVLVGIALYNKYGSSFGV